MESFLKHHLNDNHCFLCGAVLADATRSVEHVIPDWLQEAYDLRDKSLVLLNDTSIPYRQLVIPCCNTCNNEPLSAMERDVSALLLGPFRKPTPREELRLFQWCSKILYGMLHREMLLLTDRRDVSIGPIVQRQFLEQLTTFHHFMTSIRRPFKFVDFVPYSLFTIETATFDSPCLNFDYSDFVIMGREGELTVTLVFAVRVGHFGVICVPNDNGYQQKHFQYLYDKFQGIPLHPIQFIEFACKTAYKHSLLSFVPRYHSAASQCSNSEVTVVQANFPDGNIWADWNYRDYVAVFYSVVTRNLGPNLSLDQFYVDGKHRTWLFDECGVPKRMNANDNGEPPQ